MKRMVDRNAAEQRRHAAFERREVLRKKAGAGGMDPKLKRAYLDGPDSFKEASEAFRQANAMSIDEYRNRAGGGEVIPGGGYMPDVPGTPWGSGQNRAGSINEIRRKPLSAFSGVNRLGGRV